MLARPAFVARFLDRLPDHRSLRFRAVAWTGVVAGTFGLLLVLAAVQLDAKRCAEVARERAVTLAHVAGAWLDGDAHAGLGAEPEKALSDARAVLARVLEESDFEGRVRTLRPRPEFKATLAAEPAKARAGALEVVLEIGAKPTKEPLDYRPEMAAALFEHASASVVSGGTVSAFAPVPDSWGAAPALVWVEAPSGAPLWRRLAFGFGTALFAGLCVSFFVWRARRAAEELAREIGALDANVRALAEGAGGVELATPSAPRELAELAEGLALLVERSAPRGGGPPSQTPTAPARPSSPAATEASEFDLALLMQQLVEPARKQAQTRGIDLQLVFPEGVPAQVVGHPMVLFRALEALLRRALRVTSRGRISLRISRMGEGADGTRLRFEVADTSPGIAFKDQQELQAALAAAAGADPETQQDPLHLASALAASLGGELGFESQPGQGSRFGFTAAVRTNAPTGATGFQPRAATAFQPSPVSAFVPRSRVRAG
jgi:hypothetical protein